MKIKILLMSVFAVSFLLSCNDNVIVGEKYYPNGRLKEKIKRNGANEEITNYYPNGVVSKVYNCKDDVMTGEFVSYDEDSQLSSKGYFWNGQQVGPTFYFNKGQIVLYNERDLHNKVYYVKKYDSVTHELIKEEGLCLSVKPLLQEFINEQFLYFSYSQPDGYINNIKAEINGRNIIIDRLEGHIGLIKLRVPDDIGKVVKIFSILKFNSEIICRDSIQEFIISRN